MALVNPHGGGPLKPLLLQGDALKAEQARAKSLPKIKVSSREAGDLIMLGIGGFTPLDGFMTQADWQGVCDGMKMANGLFWPIPITLSTDDDRRASRPATRSRWSTPRPARSWRTMKVTEKYAHRQGARVHAGLQDHRPRAPGRQDGDGAGRSQPCRPGQGAVAPAASRKKYGDLFMTPAETRALFEKMGWSKIAAFQTRNPMHRSHEYLAKIAIEICDGVLIHSLLGALKPGDIPAEVRSEGHRRAGRQLLRARTPCIQAGYPLDMRYAGPREALLHALFRQNYGCSHLIVGRDHAGVGDYYGPFDAQQIFDEIPKGALETETLKIDWTFWCYKCGGMASQRTCPHTKDDRILLSGTKLRSMLSEGEDLPVEFSRPKSPRCCRSTTPA